MWKYCTHPSWSTPSQIDSSWSNMTWEAWVHRILSLTERKSSRIALILGDISSFIRSDKWNDDLFGRVVLHLMPRLFCCSHAHYFKDMLLIDAFSSAETPAWCELEMRFEQTSTMKSRHVSLWIFESNPLFYKRSVFQSCTRNTHKSRNICRTNNVRNHLYAGRNEILSRRALSLSFILIKN